MWKRLVLTLFATTTRAASLCSSCTSHNVIDPGCLKVASETFCTHPELLDMEDRSLLHGTRTECQREFIHSVNEEGSILRSRVEDYLDFHCGEDDIPTAIRRLFHVEAPLEGPVEWYEPSIPPVASEPPVVPEPPVLEAEPPVLEAEPPVALEPPVLEAEPPVNPETPPILPSYDYRISFRADFAISIPCDSMIVTEANSVRDHCLQSMFDESMFAFADPSCRVLTFRALLNHGSSDEHDMGLTFDVLSEEDELAMHLDYVTGLVDDELVANAIIQAFADVLPGVTVSNITVSMPVVYAADGSIVPTQPPRSDTQKDDDNNVGLGIGLGVGLGGGLSLFFAGFIVYMLKKKGVQKRQPYLRK